MCVSLSICTYICHFLSSVPPLLLVFLYVWMYVHMSHFVALEPVSHFPQTAGISLSHRSIGHILDTDLTDLIKARQPAARLPGTCGEKQINVAWLSSW